MAKYIDKDALVAEIKRRMNENVGKQALPQYFGMVEEDLNILSFLNTLEVKEMDLQSEIDRLWDNTSDNFSEDGWKEFEDIAKHFFELGLQARHDNWKVVDNTNIPQEDRNKIYCVFTKGRYILAKVINHPEDEELLQWKCTEFPHHGYDMCEGDKYMQIV